MRGEGLRLDEEDASLALEREGGLARRDLGLEDCEPEDYTELSNRMEDYLDEFDKNGLGSINIDIDN